MRSEEQGEQIDGQFRDCGADKLVGLVSVLPPPRLTISAIVHLVKLQRRKARELVEMVRRVDFANRAGLRAHYK